MCILSITSEKKWWKCQKYLIRKKVLLFCFRFVTSNLLLVTAMLWHWLYFDLLTKLVLLICFSHLIDTLNLHCTVAQDSVAFQGWRIKVVASGWTVLHSLKAVGVEHSRTVSNSACGAGGGGLLLCWGLGGGGYFSDKLKAWLTLISAKSSRNEAIMWPAICRYRCWYYIID